MFSTAVVFTDQNIVHVQTIEVPEPGPLDVVIDVEYSWISNGTESSFLRGERTAGDTPYQAGNPWPFPIVAGYQKTGYVRTVGKDVTGIAIGDHVFASISRVSGMYESFGGHVSPAVTPCDQVWKLPPGANGLDYCGMVLTQVGYNCGSRPFSITTGAAAIVLGDGMVGHWAAQTLAHRGARVLLAGKHDTRMKLLRRTIANVNTTQVPLVEAVQTFVANNGGVSVLVDTVGSIASVNELMPLFTNDAHFVSAGFYGTDGSIDIQQLRQKEATLHAPSGWTSERMDATLNGINEGWLDTRSLITHRFPVDQAAEAWRLITAKSEPFLGVVLEWS